MVPSRESAVRENAVNKGSELETDFADEQELQEALEEENTAQDKFLKRIKNWAEEKKMKYNIYKFIMLFVVLSLCSDFLIHPWRMEYNVFTIMNWEKVIKIKFQKSIHMQWQYNFC